MNILILIRKVLQQLEMRDPAAEWVDGPNKEFRGEEGSEGTGRLSRCFYILKGKSQIIKRKPGW